MRPRSKSFNPASSQRFSFNSSCGGASAIRCTSNYRSFERHSSAALGALHFPGHRERRIRWPLIASRAIFTLKAVV